MNFNLDKLQTAFFLTTIDLSSRLKVATLIQENIKQYAGSDPLILPLPSPIPSEYPQILMQNDAEGSILQVTAERLDFVVDFEKLNKVVDYHNAMRELQTISLKAYGLLAENFGAKSNRLGFIIALNAEKENANDYFQKRYLSTNMTTESEEIRLMFRHKLDVHPLKLNKWVRLVSKAEPSKIALEIDINTMADAPIVVDEKTTETFFAVVNNFIAETINAHS